ncbi:hypothetical protein UlMin_026696 [Ulmus minor]
MVRRPAIYSRMFMSWDFTRRTETLEECRQRRHRRIMMRQSRPSSTAQVNYRPSPKTLPLSNSVDNSPDSHSREDNQKNPPPAQPPSPVAPAAGLSVAERQLQNPMPFFSQISISGFSERMDDRIRVEESFCRPEITGSEPLHFFAVYDGHGGPQVSVLCKELMHRFVAEELTLVKTDGSSGSESGGRSLSSIMQWQDQLRGALQRSFERMDRVAQGFCFCKKFAYPCECKPVKMAFAGSDAVVVVLTPEHIVVANCGDARAVLRRGGLAIPLSLQHKNEVQEKMGEDGGGSGTHKVVNQDVSHSLGDHIMKSTVATAEAEISITERRPEEDECLVLASDSIWDVMGDEMACEVASALLGNHHEKDHNTNADGDDYHDHDNGGRQSSLVLDNNEEGEKEDKANAASLLCRLALARDCKENISVIVVDLKKRRS